MRYYLDTEFHEYHKQVSLFGISIGRKVSTIDLISIGIVSGDTEHTIGHKPTTAADDDISIHHKKFDREYYAISKDFNIKDAWNSFHIEKVSGDMRNSYPDGIMVYWLRENVLRPIFEELYDMYTNDIIKMQSLNVSFSYNDAYDFTYKNFKWLVNRYGKTNKQIAYEVKTFVYNEYLDNAKHGNYLMTGEPDLWMKNQIRRFPIVFYAYYADYDWIVFCQLFGKMIDLPKGFPMYCRDLKQTIDEIQNQTAIVSDVSGNKKERIKRGLKLKDHSNYPKQENEHNALDDAKWNKELHKFINKL